MLESSRVLVRRLKFFQDLCPIVVNSNLVHPGSQLCRELLLCLAIQQGRLAHILMWLHTSLVVRQKSKTGKEKVSRHNSVKIEHFCLNFYSNSNSN